MNALKSYLRGKGVEAMPPSFAERDWLKWIQANHYDVHKSGEKLFLHVSWLQ